MSIKIKKDDLGMMICPKCKDGRIHYKYDGIAGEIESWGCTNCPAEFHVDIEIKRDFNNVREATQWV